jgi:hypothetical protein
MMIVSHKSSFGAAGNISEMLFKYSFCHFLPTKTLNISFLVLAQLFHSFTMRYTSFPQPKCNDSFDGQVNFSWKKGDFKACHQHLCGELLSAVIV